MSVIERLYAALNAHEVEGFVACYAEDATIEDGYDAVLARGHDGLCAYLVEDDLIARERVLA